MINLILGGPSYRMEVDARHAASLVPFALRCAMPRMVAKKAFGGRQRLVVNESPIRIIGQHYQHCTPVAAARNGLFRESLAEAEATHFLMMDSDCAIPFAQIDLIIKALLALGDRPMFGVPCLQRDHRFNVWESAAVKWASDRPVALDGTLHECFAVGFGCVVFNLAWYREHWSAAPWFLDGWDETHGPTGEDYGHCKAISKVDGPWSPLFAGAYVDHHDRGAGKPLMPEAEARQALGAR